jgi:hypothetical protein
VIVSHPISAPQAASLSHPLLNPVATVIALVAAPFVG